MSANNLLEGYGAGQSTKFGEQLLNHIIDNAARENPELLYAELPLSPTSFDAGFRHVTYCAFANAVNGLARWLEDTLGRPHDVRHNILLLAAVKAGYKMLFTSPCYSVHAQVHLMKLLACKIMLTPAARPQITDTILDAYEMRVYQIPTFDELFDQDYPHYPFEKTFEQARGDPLVVLHTSGTTGLPKPIIWTHDWVACYAQQRALAPPPGFDSSDKLLLAARVLSTFTPFHAGHLFISLLNTIFFGNVVIYPLSGVPPSVSMILECVKHTNVQTVMLLPPLVEEIAQSPEVIAILSRNVEALFWAGGDISQAAGDAISSKLKLFTCVGSTEMGIWTSLRPIGRWDSTQWKFMKLHPSLNIEFRHRYDDLYEALVKRTTSGEDEQPIFKVFPNHQEYTAGDFFSPHPSDSQLWQYRGRSDDVQVFSSGEKYHPVTVEQHISRHPDVQAALLVGTRRSQAALLLEMKASASVLTIEQHEAAIARLWPIIQHANQMCPTVAQVSKEHVLFVNPQKMMARTAKGTVARSQTVKLYEAELDSLYARAAVALSPEPPTAHSLLLPIYVNKRTGVIASS